MDNIAAERDALARTLAQDTPEFKKANGVYYTPAHIVDYVVGHSVGKRLSDVFPDRPLRILDPACGTGAFLLGAYDYLLDWHRDWYERDGPRKHRRKVVFAAGGWSLTIAERKRILRSSIFGVDIDARAVEVTKLSLLHKALGDKIPRILPDLSCNIIQGNALLPCDDDSKRSAEPAAPAFHWPRSFQRILQSSGFDIVIGNPPWGQKELAANPAMKRFLCDLYPSTRGIHDLFRPFVEQGIRLLAKGGMFGLVLPDIVLLKNYTETRRYLLEQLALTRIDWWPMPFPSAVIDAATIVGIKQPTPKDHRVATCVRDGAMAVEHEIPQNDFWENPRLAFNVHLTPEKRRVLKKLDACPRLGDYFEVHEGVHSGNIRRELFVSSKIDDTCRELYFGRGEIVPYHMEWHGQYIRLGAMPRLRTRERYANLGQPQWHDREKILVRRTGDHVLAAIDRCRRFASNNFFLVFPRKPCSLNLAGLCALLNSQLMTWYFRAIEPRCGRVFAELKIKHLTAFPLPLASLQREGCPELNTLGARRQALAARMARVVLPHKTGALEKQAAGLDSGIETLVSDLFA